MADKTDEKKNQPALISEKEASTLTWQQKMEKGVTLNKMDAIKADADFNHRHRLREQEERAAFEARKAGLLEAQDNKKKGN